MVPFMYVIAAVFIGKFLGWIAAMFFNPDKDDDFMLIGAMVGFGISGLWFLAEMGWLPDNPKLLNFGWEPKPQGIAP